MKRCNTNPGPISLSPEHSPVRRGSLPVRNSPLSSLTSINEHAYEDVLEKPQCCNSPPQYNKHGMMNMQTNIQMSPCSTIDENDRLDRLKEVYINVDQQQTSLDKPGTALWTFSQWKRVWMNVYRLKSIISCFTKYWHSTIDDDSMYDAWVITLEWIFSPFCIYCFYTYCLRLWYYITF